MTPTKEEIKKWLKSIGQDRFWLAQQCGVEKGTVDMWLSTNRNISSKAVIKIQQLMTESQHTNTPSASLSVPIPPEFEARIKAEADKLRLAIDEFVMKILSEKAELVHQNQNENPAPDIQTLSNQTQKILDAAKSAYIDAGGNHAPKDETTDEVNRRIDEQCRQLGQAIKPVENQGKQKGQGRKPA